MLSFLFYTSIIKHGRAPKKLFKAFPLIPVGVTYFSGSQKPCQIPTQACLSKRWEITTKASCRHYSHIFSSLELHGFILRFCHQVNAWGRHDRRTSVRCFELMTPSTPNVPVEKGVKSVLSGFHTLVWEGDWTANEGHCLTFNSVLGFTNSLHQLVGCSWNGSWH